MIDRLFDGAVVPAQVDYRTDPRYRQAEETILAEEGVLRVLLGEDANHHLAALTDAYMRLQDAMARRSFKEGFCLAYELAAEVWVYHRHPHSAPEK